MNTSLGSKDTALLRALQTVLTEDFQTNGGSHLCFFIVALIEETVKNIHRNTNKYAVIFTTLIFCHAV